MIAVKLQSAAKRESVGYSSITLHQCEFVLLNSFHGRGRWPRARARRTWRSAELRGRPASTGRKTNVAIPPMRVGAGRG